MNKSRANYFNMDERIYVGVRGLRKAKWRLRRVTVIKKAPPPLPPSLPPSPSYQLLAFLLLYPREGKHINERGLDSPEEESGHSA